MAATFDQPPSNPLMVPELVSRVISFVDRPVDLLRCSSVNSMWTTPALQMLYQGSMNDMRFCTPDLSFLNSLFVQSQEHFAQYMGYVKYLTLATKRSHVPDVYRNEEKKIHDILRGRTGAALLLRPKGKGPISLAIPTELVHEDIPYLRDLILHPDLRSLIIDQYYCGLLRSGLHSGKDHPPRLSNLAALQIYQTDEQLMIDDLSVCLEHCDLKMFHLDLFEMLPGLLKEEMEPLLRRLWQHRNLQVLALRTGCDDTLGGFCADLEVQSRMPCWPELGALYLIETDDYWLRKFPLLEKLQILELRNVRIAGMEIVETIADSISRCHSLCSLDLRVNDPEDPELLPTIANGCPLLRRFLVYLQNPSTDLTGDQFSRSVRALSHLELLSFHVPFHMTASALRDLTDSCPRLTLLALKRTRLYVSMKSLLAIPPLSSLRVMELGLVRFDEHHRSTRAGGLEGVVREWKRIFPQIQHLPCPNDAAKLKSDLEDNPSISKADSTGGNSSTKNRYKTTSDSMFDDQGSDSSHLRRQLWKLLGYSPKDTSDLAFRFNHKWETDLEIELFGWPVVVMSTFDCPENYYPPDMK